jgi:hypothetical protein
MSDEIIRKLVVASLMATDAIREHNPERKWVEKMVDFGFSMQLEPELVVMYVSAAIVVEKAMGISMGSNLGLAIAWISTRMIHNTISNIPNMRDWVMR